MHIDEKFKDTSPEQTVENIRKCLATIGITLEDCWNESGIENCHSIHVRIPGGFPFFSNGKGVTPALAQASAYAEFIERLQCGLFLYKFQSITRDFSINLQSYAPDGKYVTTAELVQQGEWMDYIIENYGCGLTREKLAQQCRAYACTNEDKIWVLPYYSVFEDKYVYLPAGFVEHVYSANGCCAGNTREEAWVHALAEIMERRSAITQLLSGRAMPPIPEETLRKFPTAEKILDSIHKSGIFDIQVFDLSLGNGFPIVATRIIDKRNQTHVINIAADPVLEIAIDRTLTEIFQGRSLNNFSLTNNKCILTDMSQIPPAHNVLNQLETGNGQFTVDFFTEELSCDKPCTQFVDRRDMNNKELLDYMLGLYRDLGKPLYVRNQSFLGFHSYQLIVPGFSESRGLRLVEPTCEYAMGDTAAIALRNPKKASDGLLALLLMYHDKVKTIISRNTNFGGLAGLPLEGKGAVVYLESTLAYAAWRLRRYTTCIRYVGRLLRCTYLDEEIRKYFTCVNQYLKLKISNTPEEKIRVVLGKFYEEKYVAALYAKLDAGDSPFEDYLLSCDHASCDTCRCKDICHYHQTKFIIAAAGKVYSTFTDGQSKEHFC